MGRAHATLRRMPQPLFIALQNHLLDVTQCVAIYVSHDPDEMTPAHCLFVETRHEVHRFPFTSRAEANDILAAIRLRHRHR